MYVTNGDVRDNVPLVDGDSSWPWGPRSLALSNHLDALSSLPLES
jgi:hypothetical protein